MPKYMVEVSSIKRIRSNDYYIVEAESKEEAEENYCEGKLDGEHEMRCDVLDEDVTNVEEI